LTTAIIGVGNIGGSLARRVVGGGDLHQGGMNDKLVDLDQARAAVAAAAVAA
jgi:Trk K+ transport system NAD-binding subunit